ncbi:MAG: hypothetical protein RIB98_09330 [Acidimicrobiales bacterium]
MTHLGYLLVGWGVTIGVGLAYTVSLLQRGRRLSTRVPADRRRWMQADET